jgi:hypothetical protein
MIILTVYPKSEEEATLLKNYFEKLGVEYEETDIRSKSDVLNDFEESVKWSKKVANNEITETKTLEDLLNSSI